MMAKQSWSVSSAYSEVIDGFFEHYRLPGIIIIMIMIITMNQTPIRCRTRDLEDRMVTGSNAH